MSKAQEILSTKVTGRFKDVDFQGEPLTHQVRRFRKNLSKSLSKLLADGELHLDMKLKEVIEYLNR